MLFNNNFINYIILFQNFNGIIFLEYLYETILNYMKQNIKLIIKKINNNYDYSKLKISENYKNFCKDFELDEYIFVFDIYHILAKYKFIIIIIILFIFYIYT
jgi:hypothetical protein